MSFLSDRELPGLDLELWRLAESEAAARGFQFTSESADAIRTLIQTGVQELLRRDDSQVSAKIGEAKDAISRLVAKMVEISIEQRSREITKSVGSSGPGFLHEASFFSARNWFCPCYPFC